MLVSEIVKKSKKKAHYIEATARTYIEISVMSDIQHEGSHGGAQQLCFRILFA